MEDLDNKIYAWTPMIRMSDMKYPVYFDDFLQEHKNVSMGDWVWEESMGRDFEYFVVRDTNIPDGDVVEEGPPEKKEDGRWYKTWVSREFTEEEIADNLERSKEDHRIRAFQQFYSDLHGGVTIGEDLFSTDPCEITNLVLTKSHAMSKSSGESVLMRRADFTILEVDAKDAVTKIDEILLMAGQIHQRLLEYVKIVYSSTALEDIPEVPQTFSLGG